MTDLGINDTLKEIKVGMLGTMEDTSAEECSDDEFFRSTVNHLGAVQKINVHKIGDQARAVLVMMNDVQVEVEPDSGADVNVIDEYQYRAYKNRTRDETELLESKTKLSTLQTSLKVKGEFITTEKLIHHHLLERIIELGMLQIKEDGTLKEPNELGIQGGNVKFEHKIPDIKKQSSKD
ncbi:unnamed protein product [Mytilus coruscus]|uniref:Uncharacterized protein n=1 Tax=Mytilus coruscus TaxID=42192 RepID=A0A6J8ERR3_MYTCO|nr:unnamed protein product [Mytilus coruscus]